MDDAPDVSSAESRLPVSSASGTAGEGGCPAKSYTEAAKRARERAVCTLLPARLITIALAVGGCLLLVGACLLLHVGSPMLASAVPAEDVVFLRLDAPRSVGNWVASTLLSLAGAAAVFIFSLRRHRIDDYHGRYRVWIWVLAVCLAASLAETTGMGRLTRELCQLVANWSALRNDVLWPTTVGLVAAAMGVRLFFEIRACRWTVAALAAAVLCFLVAAAAHQDWPAGWNDAGQPLLARGSWLAGYVFVLATFLLYARHVQLDVAGAITQRAKRKRSRAKATKVEDAPSEPYEARVRPALRLRTDLDPVESSTADGASGSRAIAGAQASNASRPNGAMGAPQTSNKHLSKAERRRLRREARNARIAS